MFKQTALSFVTIIILLTALGCTSDIFTDVEDTAEDSTIRVQWTVAEGGNDHWYAVVQELVYFDDAVAHAASLEQDNMSGYLATVTSAAENSFLEGVISDLDNPGIVDQYWLGGRDQGGRWGWNNGEAWTYSNWRSNEPNNHGVETALGMNGPNDGLGTWNNSLPNGSIHTLHQFWSIVEWGQFDIDSLPDNPLLNLVQWTVAEGGNDHWYAILPQKMYWDDATVLTPTIEIENMTGYLATVASADENQFILNRVIDNLVNPGIVDQYWLGGQDVGGQWGWITGEPWTYTNWQSGEPNNTGVETVLGINGPSRSGTWNNSLPNDSHNTLHQFWSVIEWGNP